MLAIKRGRIPPGHPIDRTGTTGQSLPGQSKEPGGMRRRSTETSGAFGVKSGSSRRDLERDVEDRWDWEERGDMPVRDRPFGLKSRERTSSVDSGRTLDRIPNRRDKSILSNRRAPLPFEDITNGEEYKGEERSIPQAGKPFGLKPTAERSRLSRRNDSKSFDEGCINLFITSLTDKPSVSLFPFKADETRYRSTPSSTSQRSDRAGTSWSNPIMAEEDVDFLSDLLPRRPSTESHSSRRPAPADAYAAVLTSRRNSASSRNLPSGRGREYHSSAILRSAMRDDMDWRVPSESDYARYDRDKREARKRSAWIRRQEERGRDDGQAGKRIWTGSQGRTERLEMQAERPVVRQDDITRPFRMPRIRPPGGFTARISPESTMSTTTSTLPAEGAADLSRPDHRWAPTKRLSRPAMAGIKRLHAEDPVKYSRAALSKSFGVSVEAIARILKSDGRWHKAEDKDEQGHDDGLV